MTRTTQRMLAAAVALAGVACTEPTNSGSRSLLLSESFDAVPVAFDLTTSSYLGGGDGTTAWEPRRGGMRGEGGFGAGLGDPQRGPHGGKGGHFGGLMGGGLFGDFHGGRGHYHGGFGLKPFFVGALASSCPFDSATGRVTCAASTDRKGLTAIRSAQYVDANGAVQSAFDSTTNSVNLQIAVSGTVTRRDSSTSVVQHASNRTVGGLAKGSTQITASGTSAGHETTTGTSDSGSYTVVRIAGDTATGLVVPIENGRPTYPTAGTVIRSMKITATVAGQSPASSARREVVTYDGSATATVVITQDGTVKNCTLPLPRGRLVCQ